MRSSNPALRPFAQPQTLSDLDAREQALHSMSVKGVVNATFVLLGVTVGSAILGAMWAEANPAIVWPAGTVGFLASVAIGFALRGSPKLAVVLSPIYAILVGGFLGAISFAFEKFIAPGIVFQALLLTFGILGSLLLAYSAGLIRLGGIAQRIVISATGGVMFLYMSVFLLNMIGFNLPFVHSIMGLQGGMIGIGFSLFVVVLASLNLVLAFQMVEAGAQQGLPRYMNWYGAFALVSTLVWLYVEILILLAKLHSRD